jgi:hypothetical protein
MKLFPYFRHFPGVALEPLTLLFMLELWVDWPSQFITKKSPQFA